MGDGQHLNIVAGNGINDGVGKVLHTKPTLAVKPHCTEHGVLEQQVYGALELGEKCLRQSNAGSLSIVFSRVPKVGLCLRMQRVIH